jgi:hypothetical protein
MSSRCHFSNRVARVQIHAGCKMRSIFSRIFIVLCNLILANLMLCLMPSILHAQPTVEIYHHNSTAEGDILRARADAVIALSQAQLIHEKAVAQRLENMIRECDVAYKQFSTRNQMQKERMDQKYEMIFNGIKFNEQLLEIRRELELKGAMDHPGTGDLTDEMNLLLKKFTQSSFDKNAIAAMKIELSPEQLQAIYLSDGSNTFSAMAGKTKLETFSWPFILKMKEFDGDRAEFEKLYAQAMKESDENKNPSPETIIRLLEKKAEIDKKVDSIKLSITEDLRTTEMKWRSEAKNYIRDLTQSLNNYSVHDSERLKKYIFSGKTLGDLIEHMVSKGLRFSNPNKEDNNLYASIYFSMRYAFKEKVTTIEVTSASFDSSKRTQVILNNQEVLASSGKMRRGLYVIALDKDIIVLNQVYDCSGRIAAANQFADAIKKLPDGVVVILVVNDEATTNFNQNAQNAIVSIGGKIGLLGKPFRSAYYCIGKKGLKEGMAIEAIGTKEIHYVSRGNNQDVNSTNNESSTSETSDNFDSIESILKAARYLDFIDGTWNNDISRLLKIEKVKNGFRLVQDIRSGYPHKILLFDKVDINSSKLVISFTVEAGQVGLGFRPRGLTVGGTGLTFGVGNKYDVELWGEGGKAKITVNGKPSELKDGGVNNPSNYGYYAILPSSKCSVVFHKLHFSPQIKN